MLMSRQTNRRTCPASRLRWACFPLLAISWSCAWILPLVLDAQSGPLDEYDVKAAVRFNFARFVDWPKEALPNDHSAIRVGLVGKDPFGPALERMVMGKSVNGRELEIVRTNSLAQLKSCQIVFVSSSEMGRLAEIIMSLRGTSVLTVGESEDFAPRGGAIQFTIEDDKIRFTINVDAAERAHLKLSSKLLSLAKVIHDGPEQVKN
jgi:hypothetical protein